MSTCKLSIEPLEGGDIIQQFVLEDFTQILEGTPKVVEEFRNLVCFAFLALDSDPEYSRTLIGFHGGSWRSRCISSRQQIGDRNTRS